MWHACPVGTGDLRRALVRRVVAASLAAAAAFIGYYQLIGPLPPGESRAKLLLQNAFFTILGQIVLAIGVNRFIRTAFEPDWRWIDEGRPPDGAEREAVIRQPTRLRWFVIRAWSVAAVLSALDDVVNRDYQAAAAELVGIGLGTLANASLVYLLTERLLKPVFTQVLASGPVTTATAGVRFRFRVAWGLGAALPLAGIAVTPLLHEEGDPFPPTVAMVYLALLGLVVGTALIRLTTRSVTEPLIAVRNGLQQVREGALDANVPVDDAGEVGLLQAGFNDMVVALRERQQLEDLFGRHVGTDVARRAMEAGTALGGETVSVSVFFVDLIGSSRMAEERPADEVVAVVNRFLAQVVDAATAQGGWVNKFEGDGLCVFGAPVQQADHAARALRAAADLHSRLVSIGVDAGIGVSSGEVVAGNVGTESRYEYTVIGRPVNEAARLTDLAKQRPSRLLAAATTVALASCDGWAGAGTVDLRGMREPVAVCEPGA
jgi:adenylate cyclase